MPGGVGGAGQLLTTPIPIGRSAERSDHQPCAEQTSYQIQDTRYSVPHLELSSECALHHLKWQNLQFHLCHQGLDIELRHQRDG